MAHAAPRDFARRAFLPAGRCEPLPFDIHDADVVLAAGGIRRVEQSRLAAEPAQLTACYAQAAHELRELLPEARAKWTDDHKHEVDSKLAAFEQEVTAAKDEHARQKSYRAQIRYLQRVVIRDDVALASGGTP